MKISAPGHGQYEFIDVQMNVRHVDVMELYAASTTGLNVKGMLAFLDNDPDTATTSYAASSTNPAPFGQSAVVGHRNTFGGAIDRNTVNCPLGVVVSNHIINRDFFFSKGSTGPDFRCNQWMTIRTYGHVDRVQVLRSGFDSAHEFLFDAAAIDFGIAVSVSSAQVRAMNTLVGIATIDTSGASASLDLTGTATASVTWSPAPITALATGKPAQYAGFIGYKYTGTTSGAVRDLAERSQFVAGSTWNTTVGECSAFVCCASPSPRG